MTARLESVSHTLPPVYTEDSKILILGTMPSPKSRATNFYYAHPQNRFWPVMARLFHTDVLKDTDARRAFLRNNHIALWDVLTRCEITGADDSSIKNPVPNDINQLLRATGIEAIFTTGSKAAQLYRRLCQPHTHIEAIALPSTSPANCRFYTFEDLVEAYRVILDYLP